MLKIRSARFLSLLASSFRDMNSKTALTIYHAHEKNAHYGSGSRGMAGFGEKITGDVIETFFSKYDLKRLESYAKNLVVVAFAFGECPLRFFSSPSRLCSCLYCIRSTTTLCWTSSHSVLVWCSKSGLISHCRTPRAQFLWESDCSIRSASLHHPLWWNFNFLNI